jgi:molybdenum-dependent DNA-binding transcriptional regulator ModE
MTTQNILPQDPAWDAIVTVNQLQDMLHDEMYAGSKDYAAADLVGRVEWLISMYEAVKADRDQLVQQLVIVSNLRKQS